MKLIVAIIRQYHLDSLQLALERHAVSVISISEVLGGKRELEQRVIYGDRVVNMRGPKYRVELIVDGDQSEKVVEAIRSATTAGCPGHVSDAKIVVMQLEEAAPPSLCP